MYRFAQIHKGESKTAATLPTHSSLKPPPPGASGTDAGVINKSEFFQKAGQQRPPQYGAAAAAAARAAEFGGSNWVPTALRPVPAFYPLEKSSRLVEDDTPSEIAKRVSECLRTLSVHAVYDNDTASLLTAENVEMHLSLWKTPAGSPTQGVVVELQRRNGDSLAFHRYSRPILDAAVGLIEGGVAAAGGGRLRKPTLSGGSSGSGRDLADDVIYSKKVQRLLAMEMGKNHDLQEHENAIIAIEISHGLLVKDRMDARQLGLESLCLLTDPRKTGYVTSVLASHVVLLGTTQGVEIPGVSDEKSDVIVDEGPFQEIRDKVLALVQFSRIGDDDHDGDDAMDTAAASVDAEHMTLLHNLALLALANALDVIENPEKYCELDSTNEPEDTKPAARLRTASSSDVANEFLHQSEGLSKKDLLSTLISELGKASHKPHDATLSAKCLGSLLRASDEARRRAKELDAKTVVSAALDVGVRTHLKLETECKKVVNALEQQLADDDNNDNGGGGDDDDDQDRDRENQGDGRPKRAE